MLPLFIAALVVCVLSASTLTVLHFQMKFRLEAAGLPVKWLMMPSDDFRMWRTYRSEAFTRGWPIWPFYVYRLLYVLFGVSGLIAVLAITHV
jgi:hypothetical protein